ncbi:MAG: triose-phosphate isomerase [bacterium]|nr:triose-phosphate isomerase [bacterium]MDZ4284565.1 triose-phosphate isomerase [Patescibacteria group bacterium]
MAAGRQYFLVANWKLHPARMAEAKMLAGIAKKRANRCTRVLSVICPPAIFLAELAARYSSQRLSFGAQDCFFEERGAFTGEIAAQMIKDVRGQYVILGHSERRALGETDETVSKKVRAALGAGLTAVLCIGERERDDEGRYLAFLESQLGAALAGLSRQKLGKLMVAYEPIWAIGKGAESAMGPHDMHETSLFIRKVLRERYGERAAFAVPILYGGSVAPENAAAIVRDGEVQGLLVGHKSLDPKAFGEIMGELDSI